MTNIAVSPDSLAPAAVLFPEFHDADEQRVPAVAIDARARQDVLGPVALRSGPPVDTVS